MSTDIATLGLKIDASEVSRADQGLDKLAETGEKAEKSTKKVTSASSELMATLRQLLEAVRANTSAHTNATTATKALEAANDDAAGASRQLADALNKSATAASNQASAEAKATAETSKHGSAAAAADAHVRAFREEQERAAKASSEMADRVARLKASTDPFGVAQDKVNAELAEAQMLFERGAISAADYDRAVTVLNARNVDFAEKQARTNAMLAGAARNAKLTTSEALNLSRQFADIGVTAAMGMNPLMILIQQGPQIADIMKTSGLSIGGVVVELGKMLGILRVVEAANDNVVVSQQAVAVANGETAVSSAAATAAQARQSAANTATAVSADAAAAGETALALAEGAATAGAVEATAAAGALATANQRVAATATEAAAAEAVALAPLGVIILAIVAALATLTAGFAIFSREVSKDVGDVTKGMGLTEKQLDRIKDKGVSTTVTLGDTVKAFFQVAGERLAGAFEGPLKWLKDLASTVYEFVVEKGAWLIKETVGLFFGGYRAIQATWSMLPGAIGDIAISTANNVIKAIEDMVNGAIDRLNNLAKKANTILPESMQLGQLGRVQMGQFANPYAGQASATAQAGASAFRSGQQEGRDATGRFYNDVVSRARKNREDALREAAGDPEKGSKGRKGGKTEAEKAGEEAKKYLESLQEEIDKIGKNAIEVKMMEVEKAANNAAKNGFGELATQIRAAGDEWKKATIAEATRKLKEELSDLAEQQNYETGLLSKNTKEREVANAQREIELKLRELERQGIDISSEAIKAETDAILANAAARGDRMMKLEDMQNVAAVMRDQADAVRSASDAFGDYFGKGIQGFADLIATQAEWAAQRSDIEARIEEARQKGAEGDAERARLQQQLALGEMNNYGNLLSAAKGFFNEKSKGYKILQAAEMAYRMFQFAMSVKAMLFDSAETASSVAKSGIRTAAHAVEAVVKAISSLPFPWNLVAGAATAAAIGALGVAVFGGGGGGGASVNTGSDGSTDNATSSTKFNSYRNYNVTNGSGANDNYGSSGATMPTSAGGNNGYSGTFNQKIVIENAPEGFYLEPKSMSADEVRLIARNEVNERAPQAVARDMADPNSKTAKSMQANFEVTRRR